VAGQRAALEALGRLSGASLERFRNGSALDAPRGNAMAVKFPVGSRVRDLATGRSGVVRAGEPRAGSREELYTLELDDKRVVMRGAGELVADQALAAPPATGS